MSEEAKQSAVDILTEGLGEVFNDSVVPVSAVLLVSALDPETGEESLYLRRDSDSPAWKHLGMLDIYRDDIVCGVRDEFA